MKSKLIVFEGIDGVGKSTLISALKRRLKSLGIPAVSFEQTEGKKKGFNRIKNFIKRSAPIDASLLFYLASAVYKSALIERMLKKQWVLCDRYVYSTLVYHKINGANRQLLNSLARLPVRKPDLLFLVTVREPLRRKRILLKKSKTRQDLKPKIKGNKVYRAEREFLRFRPVVLDNSGTVRETIETVIRLAR